MAKEDLLLRSVSNPPLVTKGSELTLAEFDGNIVEIYNALVSLSQSSNIDAYDAALNYYLDDAVMEGSQLYKCIVTGPVLAVTPSTDPAKWAKIYATDLVDTPRGFKSYFASLSQSLTAAPTEHYSRNEFDKAVVWTYDSVGSYNINSTGAFPDIDKIGVFGGVSENDQVNLKWSYVDADNIIITNVKPDDGTEPNGLMSKMSFEIRVYS